ncbi:MAG: nitroreductase family protein [Tractidigestivibacter sp.]|uniref:nitroreductase family protein n=1 Tax=Tractidigestivibacter sp. TaxID=2847320 RepID=UPI003D8E9045
MNELEAISARHSVRQYLEKPIENDVRQKLQAVVDEANREGGLSMQLLFDEPKCFDNLIAHYGSFRNVSNYLAIVGADTPDLDRKAGYYGEKVVLAAQMMGLNSCWVAMSHGKTKARIEKGERLAIVIALGYGATQGRPHKSKPLEKLYSTDLASQDQIPQWFMDGMKAAQLAPTAINQQKFRFTLANGQVSATTGAGPCANIDLGIASYHFEVASGHKVG